MGEEGEEKGLGGGLEEVQFVYEAVVVELRLKLQLSLTHTLFHNNPSIITPDHQPIILPIPRVNKTPTQFYLLVI